MRENEIVVGLGNNIDYEFDWSGLDFQSIVDSHRIRFAEIQNVSVAVKSERDLVIAILNRIYRQSGGEYFLESPVLATDFARSAAKKITMGGTGIRAAIALAKIGVATTAHLVTMNDSVRKLTPALCSVIWGGRIRKPLSAFDCPVPGRRFYPFGRRAGWNRPFGGFESRNHEQRSG